VSLLHSPHYWAKTEHGVSLDANGRDMAGVLALPGDPLAGLAAAG
jgi:hypothetical protein